MNIRLPVAFTDHHEQVVRKHLVGVERLTKDDWRLLIEAMDSLRRAEIVESGRRESFSAVYDRLVDAVYADETIERLFALADPEAEGERLRAAVARRIMNDLRTTGLWRADVPASQWITAFCLYWWQVFVKGYVFEISIYRDLDKSGIHYAHHDLRKRRARFSKHDLEIMSFRGDVKTSTYFVFTRRTEALAHDFYITRMYHANARRWYQVVWLTPAFWSLLNGEPTPVAYNFVWQVLPNVAQITLRGRHFVIVLYDEWKQRVIAQQRKGID
ncbi:MAG: hypothetical protein ISS49_16250 [Anaerolineae bacterium]|nr:hypothetical protein [Anaerolineae bacterium]